MMRRFVEIIPVSLPNNRCQTEDMIGVVMVIKGPVIYSSLVLCLMISSFDQDCPPNTEAFQYEPDFDPLQ